jgi:hypothetical protein
MKGMTEYVFRIVATSAAGTCTSRDYMLTTGAVSSVPALTATIMNAAMHARGFTIICNASGLVLVYIIDGDGAPVWWARFVGSLSRAHMSWDGRHMYMIAQNASGAAVGNVTRVSMDGLDVEMNLSGIDRAHHDLTAIPGGGIATLVGSSSMADGVNSVVERSASGAITTVVADLGTVYTSFTTPATYHPNSIHYHPWDDTYTIGDTTSSVYVKITRTGELVWQLGGRAPNDPSKHFQGAPAWSTNHGHHLLADGTFLFFTNRPNLVRGLRLDTTSMTATSFLSHAPIGGVDSFVLGDVQRLPNGNILVTYSTDGEIHEITPSGQLVATFRTTSAMGYSEFRPSLYGPPAY